jgi:hypothetical protein
MIGVGRGRLNGLVTLVTEDVLDAWEWEADDRAEYRMTVIWSAEAQAQLAAIHEHVDQDAPSSIVDAMNTWTW